MLNLMVPSPNKVKPRVQAMGLVAISIPQVHLMEALNPRP